MQDRITTGAHSLRCPFCEIHELEPHGHNSARCPSCGALLSGVLLKTLREITELPLVIGHHACECGHPEMRRLPDGVYRCPACGDEVLPASRSRLAVTEKAETQSKAYWCGWLDGRYRSPECFTENTRLAEWEMASDRLDYYKGHRAGRESRQRSGFLAQAS